MTTLFKPQIILRGPSTPPTITTPIQSFTPLSGTTPTTYDSASYTPTDGSLKFIIYLTRHSTLTTPPGITLTDTLSNTWTLVADETALFTGGTAPSARMQVYAHRTSGTASMSIHAVLGATSSHTGIFGLEFVAGAASDFSNIAWNKNTVGDASVTLGSAQAATSITLGGFCAGGAGALTIPASYTSFTNGLFVGGTNLQCSICYRVGTTSPTAAWTSTNGTAEGFLLEVKQA